MDGSEGMINDEWGWIDGWMGVKGLARDQLRKSSETIPASSDDDSGNCASSLVDHDETRRQRVADREDG